MIEAIIIQDQIQKIRQCNSAIAVIADLLGKFQLDDECSNEIPKTIKNGFITGGLHDALQVIIRDSDAIAEFLEERTRPAVTEDSSEENADIQS
jgi:hypothetical protein